MILENRKDVYNRVRMSLGRELIDNTSITFLLMVLYSLCHAVAWNAHFPTDIERLLWRISSVGAVAGALAFGVVDPRKINILSLTYHICTIPLHDLLPGSGYWSAGPFIGNLIVALLIVLAMVASCVISLVVLVGAALFVLGRVYLIVESLISLRSLPKGSFEAVPWGNYWPHY
jgi:hypothetical protein